MNQKTVVEQPVRLYESAAKIHARSVKGRYARLRVIAVWCLLGLFYLLPWLSFDGRPLVLFDLPARRFHVFGLTLVPQDLFLLTGLLIAAAMTLFFFTNLAGRLWCGYACPQTVWTEAFMWIENWIEGDRLQRVKLDRSPWTLRKLRLRTSKHLLWLALALWTGLSFVGFFVPIRELIGQALDWHLQGWALFWILFYGFATWGNAGFMREQVCRYMCPYARFQSVMFDRDTLIISYDQARGEPRKQVARQDASQAGDCIDCTLCVQVCPTGIDIRDGLQYECIACAACVDACDSVMDKVGKPRGLIRYSSARRDSEGRFHFLRPRLLAYAVVWLAVIGGFAGLLLERSTLELDVIRDRHAMVRTVADGKVENIYTLKLTNKTSIARTVLVQVRSEQGEVLELSQASFLVQPYQTLREVVAISAEPLAGQPTMGLEFSARWQDLDELQARAQARFIGRAM